MQWELLWQHCWIALPFFAGVKAWRSKAVKRDGKPFDPLYWAVVCGLIFSVVFFGLFSLPFISSYIWNARRVWWSVVGSMPAEYWIVIGALLMGLLYSRLSTAGHDRLKHVALMPLVLWAVLVPPRSQLVEMNRWRAPEWRDGVCLQSTGFTCTPAAAATLLKTYGVQTDESEMAVRCATTRSGTDVLGLARGIASKLPAGKFTIRACRITPQEVAQAPLPCITFTSCHAWVIFKIENGMVEIGEGGGGRGRVSWAQFAESFCGEAVLVSKRANDTAFAAKEIRGDTDTASLTQAGWNLYQELDSGKRTLVRFGSAPIDTLMKDTEGW